MSTKSTKGALCLACSAVAQQYVSSGPVPQRPAVFAGAALVEPARQVARRGPVPRNQQISPQQQDTLTTRQRRPQAVARARINLVDDDRPAPSFPRGARITVGNDDAYASPRPAVQTPVPTPPPATLTTNLTPRPVVEEDYLEEEDEEEIGTTQASISRSSYVGQFQPQQSPTPFQRPAFLQPSAFRPAAPSPIQNQFQVQPTPQAAIIRQFPRPQQQQRPVPNIPTPIIRPTPAPQKVVPNSSYEDDEEKPQYNRQPVRQQQQQEPQYNRQPVRQQQPQQQIRRPQQQQLSEPQSFRPAPRPVQPASQQTIRQQDTYRPHPSKASTSQKEKKPVSQTLRKYHEENEDGSITWGYENDDGSFKEETIGTDCVTRGKYGYYDPDGLKREYTYQTGIPCDKEAEAEAAASANEGYIDYTENKYVFPNGDEIDLEAMVKNRARKPVGKYRN